MSEVQPIILSHKRAGSVTTHKHVANCKICVSESQSEEYAKAHPELEQIVHPDSVVGIWWKRQWVKELVGDHVQFDDDALGCVRVYRPQGVQGWKKGVMSPGRTYELIQATADRARKLGAWMFGWGQHLRPLTYNGLKPFRFGGYTPSGALGILEQAEWSWPTDVVMGDGEDYWACLMHAHVHRYSFLDKRFTFAFRGVEHRAGGQNEFRIDEGGTAASEERALVMLQRAFGKSTIFVPGDDRARRQIKLPYRY